MINVDSKLKGISNMKKFSCLVSLVLLMPFLMGCVKLALQFTPTLIPQLTQALFEECDPELAKRAIPANLKLMEGLLKSDPENKEMLTTLSIGFCGYSLLFVEANDPERASDLYLRARNYGLRALCDKECSFKDPAIIIKHLPTALKEMDEKNLKALFWATMSWNAWINLNLDKPAALAHLGLSQDCLKRVIEIDADYLYGLPNILMGVSLAARHQLFGGDIKLARSYFEKSLELSHGNFFLAQYYFARYYAVRTQDKKLFFDLIRDITNRNPHELKDVCLINKVIQHKAEQLKNMADELFF
jgi:tetratricopeptide (TPR) repeat protein